MWFWPAELHHMPLKKSSYDETLYISLSAFKTLILMLYSPRSICEIISRLADNPINSNFVATFSWDSLAFLRSVLKLSPMDTSCFKLLDINITSGCFGIYRFHSWVYINDYVNIGMYKFHSWKEKVWMKKKLEIW